MRLSVSAAVLFLVLIPSPTAVRSQGLSPAGRDAN